MLEEKYQLSLDSKLLLYKCIIKPIWAYGIQIWGTASNSNIEIIQQFQFKTLRIIVRAPWFVLDEMIHRDLNIMTVQGELKGFSDKYQKRVKRKFTYSCCGLISNSKIINVFKSMRFEICFSKTLKMFEYLKVRTIINNYGK